MKFDSNVWATLEKAIEITGVDYDIKWYDAENLDGYIEEHSIEDLIADLVVKYGKLQEELEEKEKHCREYHQEKAINYYEEYGINEKDFI